MPGKLFSFSLARLTALAAFAPLLLGSSALTVVAGCSSRHRHVLTRPGVMVDEAVRPERFASALRKLGRAHFRGLARFDAGPEAGPMDSVTTDTDIWIDDHGNWRLVEINNKDGGREIVLYGHELSVALRYGKMIRRAAEDPEPEQLLEEGIGAPFAAWELLRDVSTVDDFGREVRGGRKVHVYELSKASRPRPRSATVDPTDRRSWRRTLEADTVDGTFVVDEASGALLHVDVKSSYNMRRSDRGTEADGKREDTPMRGFVEVRTSIEDIGASPTIARAEAEDFPFRQRTVPEEKALLSGLPRQAPRRSDP